MSIFLGDTPVEIYFNGAAAGLPVQGVFLGGIQVFPAGTAATVPGAPTNVRGFFEFGNTEVSFDAPEDDGGSPITGYKFYFDGVERTPSSSPDPNTSVFSDQDYAGQDVEVSAVNAIGEGPKSEPAEITVPE
jgi:hypothetical protein